MGRVLANATPGDVSDAELRALDQEATLAMVTDGRWVGPDGHIYLAVYHPREVRVGSPDPQVVGYRKLRPNDWFVARGDDVRWGPFDTKRHALSQVRAKSGTYVDSGIYEANDHTIFRRDCAVAVLGRELTIEEET